MSGTEMTNVGGSSGGVSGGGMQNPPTGTSQPETQNIPVGLGSEGNAVSRPVMAAGNGNGLRVGESSRKKRGRPRKYAPETSMPIPLSSVPPPPVTFATNPPPQLHPPLQQQLPQQSPLQQQQPPLQQQSPLQEQQQPPLQHQQPPLPLPLSQQQQPLLQQPPPLPLSQQQQPPPSPSQQQQPPLQQQQQQPPLQQQQLPLPLPRQQQRQGGGSQRKARGRPRGGGRVLQHDEHGPPTIGFTPHIITVNTGEDVSSKIMSYTQYGPRAICILSAIGSLSNVTIRPVTPFGNSSTYEGRFEILSLSGSFSLSDGGGPRSWTGGLTVSLADPDGRVLGGGVAGLLTAASPVQVVVASIMGDGQREPRIGNLTGSVFSPARPHAATGPAGPRSPPSRGTLSESPGEARSPFNQNAGAVNSTPLTMSGGP